jgi:hypothetical protein
MLFDGTLKRGEEVPLVEALIQAGADLAFQKNRRHRHSAYGSCEPRSGRGKV